MPPHAETVLESPGLADPSGIDPTGQLPLTVIEKQNRWVLVDGRELWRRKIGGPLAPVASGPEGKKEPQPAEHISLSTRSLCDEISSGMTKDGVSRLSQDRNLRIGEKERQSNSWVFEEPNFRCTILFGEAGTVVKNKKVIITN